MLDYLESQVRGMDVNTPLTQVPPSTALLNSDASYFYCKHQEKHRLHQLCCVFVEHTASFLSADAVTRQNKSNVYIKTVDTDHCSS